MPFWKRLFGSTDAPAPAEAAGEEYKGFRITPAPIREGAQFRVAARIEKDGRRHDLIRADTMGSQDEAAAVSVRKARQVVDERGEGLFGPG
ncbi:MAG TPA: HlyU family transcriptional regulator [Paracoccaceae bacterium]|nr:HlyU family transcriptional regulator [Paracoccaceae bacterium]